MHNLWEIGYSNMQLQLKMEILKNGSLIISKLKTNTYARQKKKKNKLQRHEVASCPGFSSVTNPGKRRAIHNLSVARRGAITIENGDLKN